MPTRSAGTLRRRTATELNPPTHACRGKLWISRTSDVPFRINEVMAQNTSYITDEAGGFADWVELVNVSDERGRLRPRAHQPTQ